MQTNLFRKRQNERRNTQSITIFQFYLKVLFPKIFNDQDYASKYPQKLRAFDRNIEYNYISEIRPGQQNVYEAYIAEAAKLVYQPKNGIKIKDSSYLKNTVVSMKYLPISRTVTEQIDIVILKDQNGIRQNEINVYRSPNKANQLNLKPLERKKSIPLLSIKNNKSKGQKKLEQSYLYIFHYNSTDAKDSFRWVNFIERYHFTFREELGTMKPYIIYEACFSFGLNNGLLSLDPSNKLLQIYFQESIFDQKDTNKLQFFDQLQSKLRNIAQLNKVEKNIKVQSSSFDQKIHRRSLKLPSQHKKIFQNIKQKTVTYFSSINRRRQPNKYFLENLAARMMSNNSYKQVQSWQSIKYYLDTEKRLRQKYKWEHFSKYDKMNVFSYVGKDNMGRPVLLNRLRNVLCSKIQNFDQFFDYHFYLFQIYMQDKMEGWVDQFSVIADLSNQVSDNTNLGFTKKIIIEGFKLTYGRVNKIIAFDMGLLGKTVYGFLKTLLPSKFIECIKIIGQDRQELLEQLRNIMNDEVIPQFLGGQNPTFETMHQHEQEDTVDNKCMLLTSRSLKRL